MNDECAPLVITVEQSVSRTEEIEFATERLNPILRRLAKEAARLTEAEGRIRGSTGVYTKVVVGFSKAYM